MIKRDLPWLIPEYEQAISVVANGKFPTSGEILQQLVASRLIIACDGAINQLIAHQITVDYVIGDGDSAALVNKSTAKNPYIHVPEQDSNDLSKAINWLIEQGMTNQAVVIYAANGLREDHALANIALLAQFAIAMPALCMLSDFGIWQALRPGINRINAFQGQQISFFDLSQNAQISCNQLKWPLEKYQLPHLNSGTLNQACAEQLTIECDQPILVYRAFEIK